MHRSQSFTSEQSESQLPPFGGIGWFMVIQSGPGSRRDDRSGFGGFSEPLPQTAVESARREGHAPRSRNQLAFARDWLRRVLELRTRRV